MDNIVIEESNQNDSREISYNTSFFIEELQITKDEIPDGWVFPY